MQLHHLMKCLIRQNVYEMKPLIREQGIRTQRCNSSSTKYIFNLPEKPNKDGYVTLKWIFLFFQREK